MITSGLYIRLSAAPLAHEGSVFKEVKEGLNYPMTYVKHSKKEELNQFISYANLKLQTKKNLLQIPSVCTGPSI